MAWTQLKEPNLSVVGKIEWCLKYARDVYGIPALFQTAWTAWMSTKYAHKNRDFPPVAIPVWFRYPAGGTEPGHVAVRLPNGQIYSSPHTKAIGHNVLNSIEEVERLYGARYVGWSEDLNNVRVVKEEEVADKVTKEVSRVLQFALLGRNGLAGRPNALTEDTGTPWVGAELTNTFINDVFASPEAVQYRQDAKLDNTIPGVNRRLADVDGEFVETKVYVKKG